jgi:hypothetical protein
VQWIGISKGAFPQTFKPWNHGHLASMFGVNTPLGLHVEDIYIIVNPITMVPLGTTIQGHVGAYEWHYMINGSYFCVAFLLFFFHWHFNYIMLQMHPKFLKNVIDIHLINYKCHKLIDKSSYHCFLFLKSHVS